MRRNEIARGLLLAVVVGSAAAGTARGEDSLAFPFQSKARTPEGEAFRLTFSPGSGDIYEERIVQSGKTTVPAVGGSREKPITASLTVVHRCEKVSPDGTHAMTSRLEKVEGDDADDAELAAEMLKVVVTWEADRLGAITRRTAAGGTEEARSKVEGWLFAPGARAFLVFPAAGVRVGQALDYVKMFDAADVKGALVSKDAPATPEAKSEAVCVRKTTVGGESAVEFALNAVVLAAFNLPGEEGRMESAARYTGSVVVSMKSGMPIGRTETRIEGRVGVLRTGVWTTVTRDVKSIREFKKR